MRVVTAFCLACVCAELLVEGIVRVVSSTGFKNPVPLFNTFPAGSHMSNAPSVIRMGVSLIFQIPSSM